MKRELTIAVIGGREPSDEDAKLAEEVGREIAENGAVLVCGGLGGIMEAACRGASEAGGLTVGILPTGTPDDANPYVWIPIATGVGYARNLTVVSTARAVIAIDGSYGTLSEIAYALAENRPVIGLNTWHISNNDLEIDPIIRCTTAGEAVRKAIELAHAEQDNENE